MPLSGRLIFGEMNLFAEGEALASFASTSIGRHAPAPSCVCACERGRSEGGPVPSDPKQAAGEGEEV